METNKESARYQYVNRTTLEIYT